MERVPKNRLDPDAVPLTPSQLTRLSQVADINVEEIRGASVRDLTDKLKWKINPALFFMQQVCGKVVKTDPVTGLDLPVPFATVHVYDTDCSFLGLFPVESPWAWFFPYFCRREEIATVTTDECGNFCVWIPRFEIDWILRWRRRFYCYPRLFVKPSLSDILEHFKVLPEQPVFRHPIPEPDPAPFMLTNGGKAFQRVQQLVGPTSAQRLAVSEQMLMAGNMRSRSSELLERQAFTEPKAPPVPRELAEVYQRGGIEGIAKQYKLPVEQLKDLDLRRWVGPFLRWECKTVFFPEIHPIIDVPDVTFEVTQDVNADGVQEVIYSEGFFDVRWNDTNIPDVTLHASPIAITGLDCDHVPTLGPCGIPELQTIDILPISAALIAPATGYGIMPNRPLPDADSTAPLAGTLRFFGCVDFDGARFYRILYSYNGGTPIPFTNTFNLWDEVAEVPVPVTFSDGWYPITYPFVNPNISLLYRNLLLELPPAARGEYVLTLELGDAGKNLIPAATAAPVKIYIDNTGPNGSFTKLEYSFSPITLTTPGLPELSFGCPIIRRPVGSTVYLRLSYEVSAFHLFTAGVSGAGCDNTPLTLTGETSFHYSGLFDNVATGKVLATIPADEGAYSFDLSANSRAFYPALETTTTLNIPHINAPIGGVYDHVAIAIVDECE
jgi:hypothetical protein